MKNEKSEKVISLVEARRRMSNAGLSQNEVAVLARIEARERGLHRALKLARVNVSLFYSGKIAQGHVQRAIIFASEKYLGVEIDEDLDVA